jgi:hypothetical protein
MSEIGLLKAHRRVSVRRHDTNHRFGFCRHSCSREACCHRYRKTGQWRSLPSKLGESGISASVLAQADGTGRRSNLARIASADCELAIHKIA